MEVQGPDRCAPYKYEIYIPEVTNNHFERLMHELPNKPFIADEGGKKRTYQVKVDLSYGHNALNDYPAHYFLEIDTDSGKRTPIAVFERGKFPDNRPVTYLNEMIEGIVNDGRIVQEMTYKHPAKSFDPKKHTLQVEEKDLLNVKESYDNCFVYVEGLTSPDKLKQGKDSTQQTLSILKNLKDRPYVNDTMRTWYQLEYNSDSELPAPKAFFLQCGSMQNRGVAVFDNSKLDSLASTPVKVDDMLATARTTGKVVQRVRTEHPVKQFDWKKNSLKISLPT